MAEIKDLKCSTSFLELLNGEKIDLKISFGLLYQLRVKRKELYERYSKTILLGTKDLFEFIEIIYVAYLCANINNIDNCMQFNEFIELVPNDTTKLLTLANELTQPKKKVEFKNAFKNHTGIIPSKYKIPKFKLEDIEDFYTYYVLIFGISEEIFWNCDYSFILSIVENKIAYDDYITYIKVKELEKINKK